MIRNPLLVIPLLVCPGLCLPALPAKAAVTAQALVENHLRAAGGRDKLQKLTSQLLKADAQEGDGTFSAEISFKDADKILIYASAPNGFTVRQGYDGQGHWWRQDPKGVREFTGPKEQLELREMSLALSARAPLDLQKHLPQLELGPEEKVGPLDCNMLEARGSNGTSLKLWFDKKSGLLAKVGSSLLEDYRPVKGIMVPHQVRNGSGLLLKVKSVAFNLPMQDSQFAMPSEPAPAADTKSDADLYSTKLNPDSQLGIVRTPAPADFGRGPLLSLPVYEPGSRKPFQVDLRCFNLSSLVLDDCLADLLHADFDSKTVWPAKMPDRFQPNEIMEQAKNPGLRVRELHRKGITGKGIGIAIIDQALLLNHVEYKDQLRSYEEIHSPTDCAAQMHGPAVASIAVGKSVGVAPEADLYYIAEMHGTGGREKFEWDFTWLAKSIERILELNSSLPPERKIRVISISVGWMPGQKGCAETDAAVDKAKTAGVFVISTALERTHKLAFHGLGRAPLKDPEQPVSYSTGSWWTDSFYKGPYQFQPGKRLLVPMDARTTASPTGEKDYVYYSSGGWSWSVPYLAGLYALACQVNPSVTPELFWETALKTGHIINLEHEGKTHQFGNIANAPALIAALQKP